MAVFEREFQPNSTPLLEDTSDLHLELDDVIQHHLHVTKGKTFSYERCRAFMLTGTCPRGDKCPYRHIVQKDDVCSYWFRSLCMKGEDCEFMHVYDLDRMPECRHLRDKGRCDSDDCDFLHVLKENRLRDCQAYLRGFCPNGPLCKNRHIRKTPCARYMAGFCPDGPRCKFTHPKFEAPSSAHESRRVMLCHICHRPGHKAAVCPLAPQRSAASGAGYGQPYGAPSQAPAGSAGGMPPPSAMNPYAMADVDDSGAAEGTALDAAGGILRQRSQAAMSAQQQQQQQLGMGAAMGRPMGPPTGMAGPALGDFGARGPRKPLHEVQCFKCGQMGHYANRCTQPPTGQRPPGAPGGGPPGTALGQPGALAANPLLSQTLLSPSGVGPPGAFAGAPVPGPPSAAASRALVADALARIEAARRKAVFPGAAPQLAPPR